jgi:peptidoglycan/LPS O-acetylase OafA/YrhL
MKILNRPEIDGLRAIAVCSIIIYHSQISFLDYEFLKGGFIGVDIFFFISGYLITLSLLRELILTDTLSFKIFFKKRIRKIFPIFLTVLLTSFLLSWIYLYSSDFILYAKSVITSLAFISNFFYHYSELSFGSVKYFRNPLTHTWALSVLAQFYIFFPFLLFFIFKFFKKYIVYFLFFLFICSLLLANWLSAHAPYFNFYVLPTRFWEFLAGSILAYYEINKVLQKNKKKFNLIFLIIGLLLIIYSLFFFNDELNKSIFYPSFHTIIPIIGCFLILWFSRENDYIKKIFSIKIIIGLGLISYPLYLWHFPILAFARFNGYYKDSFLNVLFIFFIIVILSIISYYFLEKKIQIINIKNFFKVLTISTLIIFVTNISVIKSEGFKNRFSKIYLKNNIDNSQLGLETWKYIKKFNDQKLNKSLEFEKTNKTNILIIGDSHSLDLLNIFILNNKLFPKYEFSRYHYNFFWQGNSIENNKEIEIFQKSKIFQQSDIILISDNFSDNHSVEKKAFDKLDKFISLLKHKKKIVLTSNANIYDANKNYKNLYNLMLFDYYLLKYSNLKYLIDKDLNNETINKINHYYFNNRKREIIDEINNKLILLSKKHNVKILHKEDFQCEIQKKICFGSTPDGYKTNHDESHVTFDGAIFFGKRIYEIDWLKF